MSYLLDTCVLSEYVKKRPDETVIGWLDEQEKESLFISVLSVGELKKGAIKIANTQPERYQKLWKWIQAIESRFSDKIISLDHNIINRWAKICGRSEAKGQKLPIMDSLIAATAYEYDLVIVSRNVTDFRFSSVRVFSPWNLS
jgi:predicted nucleic acid-binding protein